MAEIVNEFLKEYWLLKAGEMKSTEVKNNYRIYNCRVKIMGACDDEGIGQCA